MAEISQNQVSKIARLARIHMNEADSIKMASELSKIFEVIDELQKVNTDNITETINIIDAFGKNSLREDVISDGDIQKEVLSNSKDAQYGCFSVPKVIE